MERMKPKTEKRVDVESNKPLLKDKRMQKVLAFGLTNFRRITKPDKFAGKGEGSRVIEKRLANIAAGKVQVTECPKSSSQT